MIDSPAEGNEDDAKFEKEITQFIGKLEPLTTLPGKEISACAVSVTAEAKELKETFTRLLPENASAKLLELQKKIAAESVNETQCLVEAQAMMDESSDEWREHEDQIAIIYSAMKDVPGFAG